MLLFVVESIELPKIVGEAVDPKKLDEIGVRRELLINNSHRGEKETEIPGIGPSEFATIPREIANTRTARRLERARHRENPKKGPLASCERT